MSEPLEVRDLTVDFDGFKAISGVDVTLLQGRLHFLIGPTGAVLAAGTVAEIQADRRVQEVYLGTVTEVAAHG